MLVLTIFINTASSRGTAVEAFLAQVVYERDL